MAIYIDPPKNGWCHMMCDGDIAELHAFANLIGMRRRWFQNKPGHPHYDLRPTKQQLAIQNGAILVSSRDLIKICVWRNKPPSRTH